MPFTEPTAVPSSPPTYSTPSNDDLAAVAVTVSLVGVLMALLVTWLVLRLRRASKAQSKSIPIPISISSRPVSTTSTTFRPSFAPSEASSKFGFIRKPLRLSHRHEDGSWDFADPDPFSNPKEIPFDPPVPIPSPKHRPAPLTSLPAYMPRAHRTSTPKDELGPRTPTTPASIDFVEPPPPAYHPGSPSWSLYQPKVLSSS